LWIVYGISPTLTRYTNFRPETLIGWHRRYVKHWWWIISRAGKRNSSGRPKIDGSIEKIIVDIKIANPSYGAKRISALVSKQLDVTVSETTVRNVLARNLNKPKSPTTPEKLQNWRTFLGNHRTSIASMDFKVTFDWRAKPLFIEVALKIRTVR